MNITDLVCVNHFVDGEYSYQEPGIVVSKSDEAIDVMVFGRDGKSTLVQNLTEGEGLGQYTIDPR